MTRVKFADIPHGGHFDYRHRRWMRLTTIDANLGGHARSYNLSGKVVIKYFDGDTIVDPDPLNSLVQRMSEIGVSRL